MIRLGGLNDTIMVKISQNKQEILEIFIKAGKGQFFASSEIHAQLTETGRKLSLVTVKRDLGELRDLNMLESSGSGRSAAYAIGPYGRLFADIDAKAYCAIEPDKRYGLSEYSFEILGTFLKNMFLDSEISVLDEATSVYRKHAESMSKTLKEKELERFIIELSWKSSKIEGNTYTLLDTERLIREGIAAPGHARIEADMILNHKEAFKFVREHQNFFRKLTVSNIEHVHKILVKDLGVSHGLRSTLVGVTGSKYRPLDNIHQIREALQHLCDVINGIESPYAKAMAALLGISYIQPFEDGNKRTSRLVADAILLAYDLAPLSYRSVDEIGYKEAMLVFYELNSATSFRKIFIDQYVFAAENYSVS
jgi:Fic family protein